MKVLWIVNTIFPYPAKQLGIKKTCFGGWLNAMAEKICEVDTINIAIATVYSGKEILECSDGKITYYLIPGAPAIKYNKNIEKYWDEINKKFHPDIVHIHGTEFSHGLAFQNACPSVKTVVSIQGLTSEIAKVYYSNINFLDIIKNITLRDILRRDTIFDQKKKFVKRGKNEIKIIKNSYCIIGRTSWDYSNCKAIKPDMHYYSVNENLREAFYNNNWNVQNIEKHSIFCSQASYPIKGLHMMIDALKILSNNYNDVHLYIAGPNIIEDKSIIKKLKISGYAKYIKKLILKNNLKDKITFTGILDEDEMAKRLLKTNVYTLNSIIENESNSLSEAAIVGVPVVCSYVGGIPDRVQHGNNGYLYPYTESNMLAEYISKLFDSDEICKKFSIEGRTISNSRHDKENNMKILLKIYNSIGGKENI